MLGLISSDENNTLSKRNVINFFQTGLQVDNALLLEKRGHYHILVSMFLVE